MEYRPIIFAVVYRFPLYFFPISESNFDYLNQKYKLGLKENVKLKLLGTKIRPIATNLNFKLIFANRCR